MEKGTLVLGRRSGEAIMIGEDITVRIMEIKPGYTKVSVTAPKDVDVWREEIFRKIQEENGNDR